MSIFVSKINKSWFVSNQCIPTYRTLRRHNNLFILNISDWIMKKIEFLIIYISLLKSSVIFLPLHICKNAEVIDKIKVPIRWWVVNTLGSNRAHIVLLKKPTCTYTYRPSFFGPKNRHVLYMYVLIPKMNIRGILCALIGA